MKKMGMISFSLTGAVLSEKLEAYWKKQGWQVENVSKSVYLPSSFQGSQESGPEDSFRTVRR